MKYYSKIHTNLTLVERKAVTYRLWLFGLMTVLPWLSAYLLTMLTSGNKFGSYTGAVRIMTETFSMLNYWLIITKVY